MVVTMASKARYICMEEAVVHNCNDCRRNALTIRYFQDSFGVLFYW